MEEYKNPFLNSYLVLIDVLKEEQVFPYAPGDKDIGDLVRRAAKEVPEIAHYNVKFIIPGTYDRKQVVSVLSKEEIEEYLIEKRKRKHKIRLHYTELSPAEKRKFWGMIESIEPDENDCIIWDFEKFPTEEKFGKLYLTADIARYRQHAYPLYRIVRQEGWNIDGTPHVRAYPMPAHRLNFEIAYDIDTKGIRLWHYCAVSLCMNHEHLYIAPPGKGNPATKWTPFLHRKGWLTGATIAFIRMQLEKGEEVNEIAASARLLPSTVKWAIKRFLESSENESS